MDKSLRTILLAAGIIVAAIGALIVWRGVTQMIPVTGLAHGGLFTLGGAAFLILGLCLIIVPQVKGRKKAEQEEEHAG